MIRRVSSVEGYSITFRHKIIKWRIKFMNKKILKIIAVASLAGGMAFAGNVRDNCGCGLGSMALGDEEGLASNLAATFLNAISGNQTFGISSGTLGCDQANTLTGLRQAEEYIAGNMDHLAFDIASGEGAALDSVADLLNVDEEIRLVYFQNLQNNFASIFSDEEVNAKEVLNKMASLLI